MEYRPLDSARNDIRLLTLYPPAKMRFDKAKQTELIRCRLDHFSLDDCCEDIDYRLSRANRSDWGDRFDWGDFVALSYVWGPPEPTREILLNGRCIAIRENLEAALRAMVGLEEARQSLKVWADALCINQNDLEE
jgi:hypothetical protein